MPNYPNAVNDAREADLRAHTRWQELQIEQLAGRLIPRDFVEKQVAKYSRMHRDGWLSWCARIAPDAAMVFNCSEADAREFLDSKVREQFAEFRSLQLDGQEGTDGASTGSSSVPMARAAGKRVGVGRPASATKQRR